MITLNWLELVLVGVFGFPVFCLLFAFLVWTVKIVIYLIKTGLVVLNENLGNAGEDKK